MNNIIKNEHLSTQNSQNSESLVVLQDGDQTLVMLIKRSIRTLVVRNTDGVDQRYELTVYQVGTLEIVNGASGQTTPDVQDSERQNCTVRQPASSAAQLADRLLM